MAQGLMGARQGGPEARPAIVVLSQGGMESGRKAAALLGGELFALAGRVEGAGTAFAETAETLRALFAAGRPVVGLCAAGILIRCLAPLLAEGDGGGKRVEPPVLALAEDGSSVVPLLGGHRGANALARQLGEAFGVAPAVTTAGDLRLGVALDQPPPGWRLANPEHAKRVMARLLAGEPARIEGEAAWLSGLPQAADAPLTLQVTERATAGNDATLVFHPPVLALGVGCERGCDPAELRALVRESLAQAGLAEGAVAGVFSLDLKADEPAVHALAADLDVPARFFGAARLEAETPRLAQPSDLVFAEVGCHGVAEGAALAAAGAEGRLLLAKRKSARATCAVALAPVPLDAAATGRPQGRLHVVGIGPGQDAWRTPEATRLIVEAEELVGYGLYLDLLGPLAAGKRRHDYALGEEEQRVRTALALAAEGRTVALVCSGDAGIYAMATLVFELLERAEAAAWCRVEVVVAPGVSALQAAAARAGAPLGHDFCTISLSDLLTPWPAIERRLKAAAEGDFVVAFYNPVSRRRTWQLARAREILLERRPPDTPVILAANLGRAAEQVQLRTLETLDPAEVDMLTVVLVGSSETRTVVRGDGQGAGGHWVYTPRGYAAKAERQAG